MQYPAYAVLAAAILGIGAGYAVASRETAKLKSDMALTKSSLLQVLALIAAAQATAVTEREKSAQLANRVAEFKEDHDLVNDPEVNDALGRVLRAAEQAPINADATAANAALQGFLDNDGDGKDDRTDNTRESTGRPVADANFNEDGSPKGDTLPTQIAPPPAPTGGDTSVPQSAAPTGEGTPSPTPGATEGGAPQQG